jgi:adenylate cyclase
MAVFGAPVSQSDCTLNAVRAALEMRTRLQDFNLARQIGGQAPVRVGIGINFGEAVVGNIGSRERMDYTVIGDTVNVAQRIQAGASSGQIVLAEDAYRRVAERVEARPLGRFQLKGRTRELELFEVVDLKECEKPA